MTKERIDWALAEPDRCEKTARNYTSIVALALGFILIKSVHIAPPSPAT